jgi:hypothetical protein
MSVADRSAQSRPFNIAFVRLRRATMAAKAAVIAASNLNVLA